MVLLFSDPNTNNLIDNNVQQQEYEIFRLLYVSTITKMDGNEEVKDPGQRERRRHEERWVQH